MDKRKIGIMGGSFNPVHAGHLMVADYLRQAAALDEVWLSMSPANPLKTTNLLAPDHDRLAMLNIATATAGHLKAIDTECRLPRPSYTYNLLRALDLQYPDCSFTLIIGSDNWLIFDKWRDYDKILAEYGVIVYPRPGYDVSGDVRVVKAPLIEISSTFVRQSIKDGKDMNFFLPPGVYKYIVENKLYV